MNGKTIANTSHNAYVKAVNGLKVLIRLIRLNQISSREKSTIAPFALTPSDLSKEFAFSEAISKLLCKECGL